MISEFALYAIALSALVLGVLFVPVGADPAVKLKKWTENSGGSNEDRRR